MHEITKKVSNICDVCKSDKSITKRKIYQQNNKYPVYAASIDKPIGYAENYVIV